MWNRKHLKKGTNSLFLRLLSPLQNEKCIYNYNMKEQTTTTWSYLKNKFWSIFYIFRPNGPVSCKF